MLYVGRHIILFAILMASILASAAQESPQGFTLQGRLMDATGTTALTGPVNLTITVLDKNKQCILYEETQSSVSLTNGIFAVYVGSGTTTGNSPGQTLANVFANTATTLTGLTGTGCSGSYTRAAGDERYLRIAVGGTTLTSDIKMISVPQALVAETLQGKTTADFINVSGTVTQTNLDTLTNNLDASTLHNHDSLYVKVNASDTYNIGASNMYTSSGKLGLGTGAAPTGTSPQLEVANTGANNVATLIKSHAAQNNDLLQIVTSSGTGLTTVSKTGNITTNGVVSTTTTAGSDGLFGESTGLGGKGVTGRADNFGSGVYGTSTNGYGVYGTSTTGYGGFFYTTGNNASLVARGGTSDIQLWLNAQGTSVSKINSTGQFIGDGSQLTGVISTDTTKVSKAGGDTIANTSDVVGLTITANPAQTKNLQEWINVNGTAFVQVGSGASLAVVGPQAINMQVANSSTNVLNVTSTGTGNAITATSATGSAGIFQHTSTSTSPAVVVAGATGATGDLQQWRVATGTAAIRIGSDGILYGNGSGLTGISGGGGGMTDPMSADGDMIYRSGGSPVRLAKGSANDVLTSNGSIPVWSSISNANVSATAGILLSKLEAVSAGKFLVGDGSHVTAVTMSGEATVDAAGVITLDSTIPRKNQTNTFTKANTFAADTDTAGLVLKSFANGTSPITQWINNKGTATYRIDPTGTISDNFDLAPKSYVDSVSTATGSNYVKRDGTNSFTAYVDVDGSAAPSASGAGKGRIYFDSTANAFKVSENGGTYTNLLGSGGTDSTKVSKDGGDVIFNTTDVVGVAIRANGSQSKDLQQWRNTQGTAILRVNVSGQLVGDGSQLTGVSATDSTKVSKTGGDTIVSGSNITSLAIRNNGSQTADLQNWQNSNGTGVLRVNASGQLIGDGSQLTGISTVDSSKVAKTGDSMTGALSIDVAADVIPLTITGHTTQTSDLMKVIAETGTTVFRIGGDGKVYDNGTTPTATAQLTNKAYVDSQTSSLPYLKTDGTSQMSGTINSDLGSTDAIGLKIRPSSSQTLDLTAWTNRNGTAVLRVNASGQLVGDGSQLTGTSATDSTKVSKAGGDTIINGSNVIGLSVRANGSQTADLQTWQNSNGTGILRVNASGQLIGDGSQLTGISATDTTKVSKTGGDTIINGANVVGIAVRANGSQTADLQNWQNSNGTGILRVNASGQLVGDGSLLTGVSATDSTKVSKTGGDTIVSGSNTTSLAIRNNGSQTADLQNWQNSNGTGVLRVNASGQLIGDGSQLTGISTVDSSKVAKTGDSMTGALSIDVAADVIPLTITGHTTQTSDLMKVIAETGTTVFRIGGDGKVYDNGTTPTATAQLTNKAYVDSQTSSLPYLKTDGTSQMSGTINSDLGSTDAIGLKIRPSSSQTLDLTAWTNRNGTAVLRVNASGQLVGDGSQLTGTSATDSTKVSKAGGDTIINGSNVIGLSVRANGSQTADLQTWQNSNGTGILRVNASGQLIGDGSQLTGVSATDSTKVSKTGGDTIINGSNVIGLSVRANGSQTADLQTWQNSNGTGILRVNASGQLVGDGSLLTGVSATDTTKVSKTGGDTIVSGSNVTSLAIRNNGSQTADLQNWQNSNGTGVLRVNASGQLVGDGSLLTGLSSTDSTKVAKAGDSMTGALAIDVAADVIPLTITGHTTQTSDLMKVIAETGTTVFRIAGDGKVYDNGTTPTVSAQLSNKAYVDSTTTSNLSNYVKKDGTVPYTAYIDVDGSAAPSASGAGKGRIYFDSTANVFKVSENGGTFTNLVGGGGSDATKVPLAGGNMTGALSIDVAADVVPLSVKGHTTQTSDLFNIVGETGTVIFKVQGDSTTFLDARGAGNTTGLAVVADTTTSATYGVIFNGTGISGMNLGEAPAIQGYNSNTTSGVGVNGINTAVTGAGVQGIALALGGVAVMGATVNDGVLFGGFSSASGGTAIFRVTSNGGINTTLVADEPGLTIKGVSSQAQDLVTATTSSGTGLFRVSPFSGTSGFRMTISDNGGLCPLGLCTGGGLTINSSYGAGLNISHSSSQPALNVLSTGTGNAISALATGTNQTALYAISSTGIAGYFSGNSTGSTYPLVQIKQYSTSTNDLFQTLNANSTATFRLSSNGQVTPASATGVGLIVRGVASQSADLQQTLNSTGTALFRVLYNGAVAMGDPNTIAVTADNQNIDVQGRPFLVFNSDNATAANRTILLNKGSKGQILVLLMNGNGNKVQIAQGSANSDSGNIYLSADWLGASRYTLMLISDGTNWYELSRSNN